MLSPGFFECIIYNHFNCFKSKSIQTMSDMKPKNQIIEKQLLDGYFGRKLDIIMVEFSRQI